MSMGTGRTGTFVIVIQVAPLIASAIYNVYDFSESAQN